MVSTSGWRRIHPPTQGYAPITSSPIVFAPENFCLFLLACRVHHLGMANNEVISSDLNDEARERIAEIAELLALGLVRLRARESTSLSAGTGDSSVDCLATPSGHAGNQPETASR